MAVAKRLEKHRAPGATAAEIAAALGVTEKDKEIVARVLGRKGVAARGLKTSPSRKRISRRPRAASVSSRDA